jgi:hypothetical protein
MKILKNKKALTSIFAILIALALIAGSTMAWWVVEDDNDSAGVTQPIPVGRLAFASQLFPDQAYIDANFGDYQFQPGATPIGFLGADDDDHGYIENTGTLPILIQLSPLNVAIFDQLGNELDVKDFLECEIVLVDCAQNQAIFAEGAFLLYDGTNYYLNLPAAKDLPAGLEPKVVMDVVVGMPSWVTDLTPFEGAVAFDISGNKMKATQSIADAAFDVFGLDYSDFFSLFVFDPFAGSLFL